MRILVITALVALAAACGNPDNSQTVDPTLADGNAAADPAGSADPSSPQNGVDGGVQVAPEVATQATAFGSACWQAWQAYDASQTAVNLTVDGPQALAAKEAGTGQASAAIQQAAQAGAALSTFLQDHPEAVNIARTNVPQTPWPTAFYPCFGTPTNATQPSSNGAASPTAGSASNTATLAAPQPGATVNN